MSTADDAPVTVEVADPVATIRLNRPERLNALTTPLMAELRAAVDDAAADPSVVGIVITGAGRGFCSGLDAEELGKVAGGGAGGRPPVRDGELPGLFSYLLRVPKPVVAAVNGVAAGGGFVLAAMADIRFASPQASFVTIFSKRGLVSEHGSSWILPRLVGPGRALDLLWSSRRIDAAEAARIGLVEHLCGEGEDVVDTARAYVRELAETVSPASLADTKRLVYSHLGMGYAAALADVDEVQWAALDRADASEGAAALLEKRPPRFPRLGAGG